MSSAGDEVVRQVSDDDQDDSFKSHSSAFLSKSSDNKNDSTAQFNYDQLMDDKTFIFSKIKGEFKDEYKVLHNLRSMVKPKNQVKDEFILLIENHSKIVFAAAVSCLLVPTLLMILSGHAEQKSLWMWFIIEVGVCVLGGAHFTRKFFGLRSEIRENLTA